MVRVTGLRKPRLGVAATLRACGRAGRMCCRAGGRLGSRRPWPLVWWPNWREKRKREGRRRLFVPKKRPDNERTRCCPRAHMLTGAQSTCEEIRGLAGRSYADPGVEAPRQRELTMLPPEELKPKAQLPGPCLGVSQTLAGCWENPDLSLPPAVYLSSS